MTLTPENAPLLLTDDDVRARVEVIVGPARQDGCVWLMLVDGDRRQAPAVVPLEDSPRRPDPHLVRGLRDMLAHFGGGPLDTATGRGSCLFVLERLGPPEINADDEEWAEALDGAAAGAGLDTLGVYSSTPAGIHRLRSALVGRGEERDDGARGRAGVDLGLHGGRAARDARRRPSS